MPKINIAKAIGFVKTAKNPVLTDLALHAVGQMQSKDVLSTIARHQRKDGGWEKADPDFMEEMSTISAAWMALRWFCWLDITDSELLNKTVAFLKRIQKPDGCWDEFESIARFKPSPWMTPGKIENRLWLTSAVCCFLHVLGLEKKVDFERAVQFIRDGWNGTRFPRHLHTHWMAMPLLTRLNSDKPVDFQIIAGCKKLLIQAVGHELVDSGDYCALAYASWLTGDNANELLNTSLERVLDNQAEDGGWMTGYSEEHRAGFTVEALFLLRKLGILAGQYV